MLSKRKICYVIMAMFLFFPAMAAPSVTAQADEMLFVMAYGSDIGELNPLFWRSERSHWYDMLVYDTLLSYDDDMEIIPWLAESYVVSTSGLQVNFTIRESAKWHDGENLTAEDVAFTFEYIRDAPEDVNWWTMLQNMTSATAYGNVVVCEFNQLFSFALHNLGEIYILPQHIWEGIPADDSRWDDEDNVTAHVGSGPFKYVERVPDEYTELERFDDWWGPDNPNAGQLPNIDRVRIDVVLGQDARILAMRNGAADTERYEVFGAYVQEILNAPELQLVTGVASQWDYVWGFNMTVNGLNDTVVRRALAYAVNRTQLINVGRLGYGTKTTSAIPEVFYPDLYDEDGVWPENIALANQILDDAGYLDNDGDGNRNFPGTAPTAELEFDLLTLSWDDISVATGDGLVSQVAQLNITLTNVVTDDGPMYDAIYTGEYEMYTMAHGYTPIPDFLWWRCHSSNIFEWGSNVFHLDNSTVDDIMDDFLAATPAQLADKAKDAQVAVLENVPYVPLYLSDDTHALRKEWVNWTSPPGGPFTAYNPRTMVFMYDDGTGIVPGSGDLTLLLGIGAGVLIVAVIIIYVVVKRR
ncbi:MAG: ABC transporter substrate-binding protein [Candidatus Thorarchaeota archaeon]|nr:ABC transporter substrate-binding protein [Candidatus Thorarchaeota archaeon]